MSKDLFKRIVSMLLVGALMFCMSACSGGSEPAEESEEPAEKSEEPAETMGGGWTISEEGAAAELPENVDKAFKKVTEELMGEALDYLEELAESEGSQEESLCSVFGVYGRSGASLQERRDLYGMQYRECILRRNDMR